VREFIGPDAIANEVRMKRSQHSGAFAIVEGDADARAYGRLCDRTTCLVINGHTKDNVTSALRTLEGEGLEGVIGIVDADFWCLEGRQPASPNLFMTDSHDLESMMLSSPVFDKLLAEFGSAEKIERFRDTVCSDLRAVLLAAAEVVGCLRWISLQQGLDLRFEGLPLTKFVNPQTLRVDTEQAVKVVLDHSQAWGLRTDDVGSQVTALRHQGRDPWQICCGHDLVGVLSLALRRTLGSHNASQVSPPVLQRSLRLAYEPAYFRQTRLFASIRAWERQNSRFRVWPIASGESSPG